MQKVKLTFVKNDKKISKNGKPYTACSIKTEETGDAFINGFGNRDTESWEPGNVVFVKLYEEEYNGKMYKKFETVKKEDLLELQIAALTKEVEAIKVKLGMSQPPSQVKQLSEQEFADFDFSLPPEF